MADFYSPERYSRYQDAMVVQARTLEWMTGRTGLNYLAGFFEDMGSHHKPEHRRAVDMLAAIQINSLRIGDPVYASSEACQMVAHAVPSFQPEKSLPGDPFTPNGFALLGSPLMIEDAKWTPSCPGRSVTGQLPIRALSWCSIHSEDYARGCFWISFYVDWRDELEMAAQFDGPLPHYDAWYAYTAAVRDAKYPPLNLAHQFQWSWGQAPWEEGTLEIQPRRDDTHDAIVRRSRSQSSVIQAFWRIASQFKPAKERAPRGIWRDSNRKGVKGRDVTVIQLRRSREYKDVEPAGRALTVRFPVRGFWRNQWYPSIREHRQIWIHPYIKGPEDAPFVMKDRAWEFTR